MKHICKRLLCLLLTLTLTLGCTCTVAAKTEEYEYTIKDGEATITKYLGSAAVVHVPETLGGCPVTAIGNYAFRNLVYLEEVYLPVGIRTIGNSAFNGAAGLTSIVIPDSVTRIGNQAFAGCTSLTTATLSASWASGGTWMFEGSGVRQIVIPDGVTYIPANAFVGAAELESVTLPATLTNIGESAFEGCSKLTGVVLPDSVRRIEGKAFAGCTSLTSINHPASIETLYGTAYSGCTALTEITLPEGITELKNLGGSPGLTSFVIPESVTTLGSYAFENCTGLTSIVIPENVTRMGSSVFSGCTSLRSVTLHAGLTKIGTDLFRNCTSLTEVTLPEGFTTIPEGMFRNAPALTCVNMPSTLARIEREAFRNCQSLTAFTFPESVTYVGYGAFLDCTSLKDISYPMSTDIEFNAPFEGCTAVTSYIIPDGATRVHPTFFSGMPNLKSVYIPDSVTEIGMYAFEECTSLTDVRLPANLAVIGKFAFSKCTALPNVTLPDAVTSIGHDAFANCLSFTAITLPDGLTKLSGGIFYGCRNLASVDLPDTITSIGEKAFFNCAALTTLELPLAWTTSAHQAFEGSGLTTVVLPEGMTEVPARAFGSFSTLKTVVLPDTITRIGDSAFADCFALETINIPDSVTHIGSGAFYRCANLKEYHYSASLQSVSYDSFQGCSGITSVVVPEGVTAIPDCAFRYMTGLQHVQLPATVTSIGKSAFAGCSSLWDITLPDGLISIGDSAFTDCKSLQRMIIPDTVTTIGSSAFLRCENLTSVTLPAAWQNVTGVVYRTVNIWGDMMSADSGYLFIGCTKLTSLSLPDGMTALPAYALSGSDVLRNVTIPASVTSIGKEAFSNCYKLRTVIFEGDACHIPADAFRASPEVIAHCDINAQILMDCIDMGVTVASSGDLASGEGVLIDRSASSYTMDARGISAEGVMDVALHLALTGDAPEGATALICLPENAELLTHTVHVDGAFSIAYEYNGRFLTLPVTGTGHEITFAIRMNQYGAMQSYAALTVPNGNATQRTLIGYHTEELNLLVISLPDTTGDDIVTVTGIAPPSTQVQVLVNGQAAATATSTRGGAWKTDVKLPSCRFGESHEITATCTVGNETTSRSGLVACVPGATQITGFTLSANGDAPVNLLDDSGIRQNVYLGINNRFRFEVAFSAPDEVGKVYITSTKGNQRAWMEATFDPELNRFVATGTFDQQNPRYVPGTLNVEYTLRLPDARVSDTFAWEMFADETAGHESAVTFTEISDQGAVAHIDLGQVDEGLRGIAVDAAITWIDDTYGTAIGDGQGLMGDAETILSYIVPGVDDSKYILTMDYSDPYTYVMVVKDAASNKGVRMAIDAASDATDDLATLRTLSDASSLLSHTSTVAGILLDQHGVAKEMDALREEVMRTPYASPEARQNALDQVDALEFDKSMFTLMATVLPLIVASGPAIGATMTAAPMLMTGILSVFTSVAPLFWDIRTAHIRGQSVLMLNYVIDPSGYVYDAVTQERIEGVTVTAYHIPLDVDDPSFWDAPPSADVYGEVWNAAEYDQANPLLTNVDGKYAWDVPEGWWRVKYEHPDYETTWSDWLPVPPPQTEVNIAMTPLPQPAPAIRPMVLIAIPAVLLCAAAFFFLRRRRR